MGVTSTGTRGESQFASAGNPPTFVADLSVVATEARKAGVRPFTTQALMIASTGSAAGEYASATAIPGVIFQLVSSTWTMIGIPRFATTGARDSAITVPAAGMLCRIGATNGYLMEHNGTRWQKVGVNAPSAAPTVTGGSSVINDDGSVTATFTGAGSITFLNTFLLAFGSDTSVLEVSRSGSASTDIMQLCAAGVPDPSATNYDIFGDAVSQAGAPVSQSFNGFGSWAFTNASVQSESRLELRHIAAGVATMGEAAIKEITTLHTAMREYRVGIIHEAPTAYDGFKWSVTAACVVTFRVTHP